MLLGQRLKEAREKKGFNQKELADACHITQATISRLEQGKVNQLKSEALRRLALALGVTTDYLVGKTNDLTPIDIFESNQEAKYLFRGYDKLSPGGRDQLMDFIKFLEEKEKKEETKE
ncbi:MAG: helix-turn-helix transcriptional regulator [Candidatus Erginobacter occultus]|nr:helix-turn-helix transcriptional regulator [Candidatus Erginobacter occultus]